jgi:heptaprenylglyceryl phosphate synthase
VEGRFELFAGGGIQAVERAAKLGAAIAGDKR